MSTTKSTQKTLFILSSITVTCLILAFVFISSSEKRFGTTRNFLKLVNPPKADREEAVLYTETNLTAPRVLCKSNYDFSVLPALQPISSTPLPNSLSVQVTSTLSATLKLNNSGEIEYFFNDLKVWKSSEPRSHLGSVEVNVFKEFIARTPSTAWKSISETSNGLRLHVSPLAVTSEKGKRIIWTFLTGWDAAAMCSSNSFSSGCEIPAQVNAKEQASMVLISKDRIKRLLLCPNADILILSRTAKERGSSTLVTSVQESLISKYCLQ